MIEQDLVGEIDIVRYGEATFCRYFPDDVCKFLLTKHAGLIGSFEQVSPSAISLPE